ncbi:MAG TPA: HipA family kinase [Gemmatimonadales bacterium]|nr:HipA family kinase [Gemmatimonadales bacterium]
MTAPRPLPLLKARRVLRRDRRGSSSPVLVETDAGPYFTKLVGAAQGPGALVAEVIVAGLADLLGLAVPARVLIDLAPETPVDDANDELADLLRASTGLNLGFEYLPRARPFHPADLDWLSPDWAAQVRWLDWLVLNPDRTPANPNILIDGRRPWLIDHGAALVFQHDWSAVTEDAPLAPGPRGQHLLDAIATRLPAWDELLTGIVTRERLAAVMDAVPEGFLGPLLPAGAGPAELARRRAAYAAFLWKRLRGPRPMRSDAPSPERGA